MNSSRRLKTPGPRSRGPLHTTYRDDFRPFNERPLQIYQLNPAPRPKPSRPALVTPPKIDSDTWARFRRYCYKTTNSSYGSSSFAQKGMSPVVTLLEGPCGGAEPNVLPALQASSLGTAAAPPPPLLEVQAAMSSGDAKQASSSSSSSSLPSSTSLGPTPPSPPPLSRTPLSPAFRPGPAHPGPARREAWTQETAVVVKETVSKATSVAAGRPSHVGSGEGSAAVPQQRWGEEPDQEVKGQGAEPYEDFLREMCRSARLEGLLKHRLASQGAVAHRGAPLEDKTTYKQSFGPAEKSIKLREACFTGPEPKHRQWRPWVTEYADRFRFLTRTFPPRVPRGTTLPQAASQPSVHYQVPSGKALRSEYQACYTNKTPRPKTSPVYRVRENLRH